ncbi:ACP S-malonyltransferase [Flagellimonas meridianipacifica]|uniref:Malonyl CoA-acyl carrier protein transacylase n=1 Tax=Flagellimonas meridianipacifica TaxID=1080225 RepID=A0A2T0MBM0_9FLAO|nr:ACP S-malonyltransferase [Allomuricauda pacifica]PRX54875.1 [acyl-carrier-protein] S-malonyltransferase [Allomuricauda pacifica]
MRAYLFPGQGTQFPGMGKELFDSSSLARTYFKHANELLGFSITEVMFDGSAADLKQTKFAQPAIFLHSYIQSKVLGDNFQPDMVAGHSLGEISALAAVSSIDFESALKLISTRASAMQSVCNIKDTGMMVVVGLHDVIVKNICKQVDGIVVPANYNTLNQVVISGEMKALEEAGKKLKYGAERVVKLTVNGAFHSPFMEPVVNEFTKAIEKTHFKKPLRPVYQNIAGRPVYDVSDIKRNLINQLTSPVMWRHTILHMIEDGATEFVEIGPGKFLSGLVNQINKKIRTCNTLV